MKPTRFMPAFAIATLAVGLLAGLGATPSALAALDPNASPVADSGKAASIHASGNFIVVGHVAGSSKQLVITVSTNAGATWTDTIVSGATDAVVPRLAVIDEDRMAFAYSTVASGGDKVYVAVTQNAGSTWTITDLTAAVGTDTAIGQLDIDAKANGYAVAFGASGSGTCGCYRMTHSSDYGATWATSVDTLIGVIGTTYVSLNAEDSDSWFIMAYHSYSTTIYATRTDNNGASFTKPAGLTEVLPTVGQIQDPFAAIGATYGHGLAVSHDSTDHIAFFQASGGTNRVYACLRQTNGQYACTMTYSSATAFPNSVVQMAGDDTNFVYSRNSINGGAWFTWSLGLSNSHFTPEATANANADHMAGIDWECPTTWLAYQDPATLKLKVAVATTSGLDCPSAPIAAQSIAATGLVAADADSSGTVVIARTNNGDNVRSYNTQTAAETGSYATTNCGPTMEAVSSFNKDGVIYLTFADCDGTGDADTLRVRGPTLGAAAFPSNCGNQCQADNEEFDNEDSDSDLDFNVPEDMKDLGTIATVPYSFTVNTDGLNAGYATWTFSTLSGEIGVVGVIYVNNEWDDGDRVLVNVNPGFAISDFCSWYNPAAEKNYVAGVEAGAATTVVEVTGQFEGNGVLRDTIDVGAATILTNTAPWGKATAIDCAANHAFIAVDNIGSATTGTLYFINVTGPTGQVGQTAQLWSKTGVDDSEPKTVALSGDSQFVAWKEDTEIVYGYASNGTEIGTLAIPTGSWVGMEFDQTGAQLFVYTSTGITIYTTAPTTCQADCSATVDDTGATLPGVVTSSATSASGGNILNPNGGGALPPGFTASTWDFFGGILLTFGMGAGLFLSFKMNIIAGGAGLVLGFLAAYAFGLFDLWMILVVVVLALAAIFIGVRGRMSGA